MSDRYYRGPIGPALNLDARFKAAIEPKPETPESAEDVPDFDEWFENACSFPCVPKRWVATWIRQREIAALEEEGGKVSRYPEPESAEAAAHHIANQTHSSEEWEGGTTHTCPLYEEALKVIRQREIAALEEAERAVCPGCAAGDVPRWNDHEEAEVHHVGVGIVEVFECQAVAIHALIEKRKERT